MIFWLVDVVPKYENSATGWYIFVKNNVDGICGCENPNFVSERVCCLYAWVCVFLELQLVWGPTV